jgi:3',5'-cyclic AMP phosphodiesterase CpdA
MRRILHMSDLHFGRSDELIVDALRRAAYDLKPDVIVVSGDLTQRARGWQFQEARRFLDGLPCRTIVVPGNHDIPLENLFARFLKPLANYRKYISNNLWPEYHDEEVAILGINTARSFTRGRGSISDRQIEYARQYFCNVPPDAIKIIVTHHPFDFAETTHDKNLLRRARHAVAALTKCRADLFLAGHSHVPFAGLTDHRYTVAHRTALVVQSGTSVSTRTRSEPNSFNLLHVEHPGIGVEHFHWSPAASRFVSVSVAHYVHTNEGWRKTKPDEVRQNPA